MAGIKHAKVSAKVDDPDTTEVNPSDWNADHTITGDVPFNAHKATGLADPTLAQDAATKAYVDGHSGGVGPGTPATVARFVTSTTLGNSSILDNGAGTTEFVGSVIFDGNVSLSGGGLTVDMGGNLVHNMVDPAAAQDAATKAYVDSKVGSLIGSGLTVGRSAYTSSSSTLSAGSFVDNGTNASIAGTLTVGQIIGTIISPTAVTGAVNDWAPTGLATAATILVTSSSSTILLNGIAGGVNGRRLRIVNNDAAQTLLIRNENAGSTAGNRILTGFGTDISLGPGLFGCVDLEYRTANSRWIVTSFQSFQAPPTSFQGNTSSLGSLSGTVVIITGAGRFQSGAVTPNTNVVGSVGDYYTWTGGGAGTTLWVKESGAATNTGWVGK